MASMWVRSRAPAPIRPSVPPAAFARCLVATADAAVRSSGRSSRARRPPVAETGTPSVEVPVLVGRTVAMLARMSTETTPDGAHRIVDHIVMVASLAELADLECPAKVSHALLAHLVPPR